MGCPSSCVTTPQPFPRCCSVVTDTHLMRSLCLMCPQDGFVQNVHIPKVRVDPDGRCAVMLIYGTRLVVLPFRRDTLTDEHEGVMGEG